jgi:hypothetical protein
MNRDGRSDPRDLLQLPPERRRFVWVTDPSVVQVLQEAERRPLPKNLRDQPEWAEGAIADYLQKNPVLNSLPAWALRASVLKAAVVLAGLAVGRRQGELLRASAVLGQLAVLPVSAAESEQLQFPHGHPRTGLVYASHPVREGSYVPLAEFHRRMFEDKFTEIMRILASLGASRIEVTASEGWSRDMAAELGVDLPAVIRTGARGGRQESVHQDLLYAAELPANRSRSLPGDLAWYWSEDTWKELGRQRLQHGLKRFTLRFEYRDNFGITAGLALGIAKQGLDIGGTFREQVDTTWILTAQFALA